MIAPSTPVITTTAAVSAGIPPKDVVTSIAIGVVTDLAAIDITTSFEAPKSFATKTALIIPTQVPISWAIISGNHKRCMALNCIYKGTPRATTAGLSQNSMSWAFSLYTEKGTLVIFK